MGGGQGRGENYGETHLLEDHLGDEPPCCSAMLKDLRKPVGYSKSRNRRNCERMCIPFDSEVSLATIFHALVVWDVSPSMNNGELSSPNNLRDGKYRPVDIGLGVPVTRDQKHISTDVNPRFMDAEGCSGPGVATLHVDVTEV